MKNHMQSTLSVLPTAQFKSFYLKVASAVPNVTGDSQNRQEGVTHTITPVIFFFFFNL